MTAPSGGWTGKLTAFPVKVSPVAIHLNLLLEEWTARPSSAPRQETCAIDVTTHALRKTDTTPFPDLTWPTPVFTDPFCRTKLKLGEEDLALRHQVRTSTPI